MPPSLKQIRESTKQVRLYTEMTRHSKEVLIAQLELILVLMGQHQYPLTDQAPIARIQIETRAALMRLDPENPALTPRQ